MNYAYNNGMPEQQQHQGPAAPTFNGGGAGPGSTMRNQANKTIRGLPAVLPDPGVQPGMMMMMNANPNNPYAQTNAAQQAPASAPSSHFSFFGHSMGNNQQPQQQQSSGPSLIQKMMGGGNTTQPGQQQQTAPTENPVEGLLSKGKDLIFKKFGL